MRTALVLLFLLALAAVPGSLLPQRPLNPPKVQAYIASHGAWGRFLDRIGAFDVFGSVWFSAVYLLLFASLVGCLVPRIAVYARALRARPLKAPRHLDRLAEHAALGTGLAPDEAARADQPGAATALAHRGADRGRRRGGRLGGEGLQPGGRQPAVPRLAAGRAGADRRRPAAELRGLDRDHRGVRFLQPADLLRHLLRRPAGAGRPAVRLLHRSAGAVPGQLSRRRHAEPSSRPGSATPTA